VEFFHAAALPSEMVGDGFNHHVWLVRTEVSVPAAQDAHFRSFGIDEDESSRSKLISQRIQSDAFDLDDRPAHLNIMVADRSPSCLLRAQEVPNSL